MRVSRALGHRREEEHYHLHCVTSDRQLTGRCRRVNGEGDAAAAGWTRCQTYE